MLTLSKALLPISPGNENMCKNSIVLCYMGEGGVEPAPYQLEVGAPVQVTIKTNTTTAEALICMRCTTLRQLLWRRLFACNLFHRRSFLRVELNSAPARVSVVLHLHAKSLKIT